MKNICEWTTCKKLGEYKAPTEKDNSKNFKWLCEEHIKKYLIKIGTILMECHKVKLKTL